MNLITYAFSTPQNSCLLITHGAAVCKNRLLYALTDFFASYHWKTDTWFEIKPPAAGSCSRSHFRLCWVNLFRLTLWWNVIVVNCFSNILILYVIGHHWNPSAFFIEEIFSIYLSYFWGVNGFHHKMCTSQFGGNILHGDTQIRDTFKTGSTLPWSLLSLLLCLLLLLFVFQALHLNALNIWSPSIWPYFSILPDLFPDFWRQLWTVTSLSLTVAAVSDTACCCNFKCRYVLSAVVRFRFSTVTMHGYVLVVQYFSALLRCWQSPLAGRSSSQNNIQWYRWHCSGDPAFCSRIIVQDHIFHHFVY